MADDRVRTVLAKLSGMPVGRPVFVDTDGNATESEVDGSVGVPTAVLILVLGKEIDTDIDGVLLSIPVLMLVLGKEIDKDMDAVLPSIPVLMLVLA